MVDKYATPLIIENVNVNVNTDGRATVGNGLQIMVCKIHHHASNSSLVVVHGQFMFQFLQRNNDLNIHGQTSVTLHNIARPPGYMCTTAVAAAAAVHVQDYRHNLR